MERNITIQENYYQSTHRSFTVNFFGTHIHTTLTSTSSVVRKWIHRMRYFNSHHLRRNRLIVGLGVQWRPSFIQGVEYPAATLQLCIGRHCLILQLLYKNSIPRAVMCFLNDPTIKFVGIWNGKDAPMLQRDHGLCVNTMDLRFLVADKLQFASMETLASAVLGLDGVEKGGDIARSRWDDRHLSEEQVQYACVDAHVSFEIGKVLKAWSSPMVEQRLPPVVNSNCPLPKKKHLQYQRFQRKLKGIMKKKRTRKRWTRIFVPYIHELVQEELKRQSLPSVPRIE